MEENKTTAVAKTESLPVSFEEISGLANAFVASGMFSDVKQLSQAIVKIQAGKELGLPPVYSMQNINIIRGRLCSSANTMASLVKSSGKYNYKIVEHDDKKCSIDFLEHGAKVGNSIFTIDDAKRAELVKPDSGWVKYPRAMLFSRAISQGARIYCPDAIGGMYTDEEIRAIPARPHYGNGEIVDTTTGELTEIKTDDIVPTSDEAFDKLESATSKAETVKPERDPSTIKNFGDLMKVCKDDWGLPTSKVLAHLNAKSTNELTDTPAECYLKLKAIYGVE